MLVRCDVRIIAETERSGEKKIPVAFPRFYEWILTQRISSPVYAGSYGYEAVGLRLNISRR